MEFRLLVPHSVGLDVTPLGGISSSPLTYGIAASEAPVNTISVNGRSWALSDRLDIDSDSIPKYTCISYRWGPDRQDHALFSNRSMSTHAVPSLVAAMKSQSDRAAFWTDVFCVPPDDGPSRQATLENMGSIYARAAEVVVVLGRDTFTVLQDMIQHKVVSERNLQVLESDQWVASVWTYQELVNAAEIRFVSEQYLDTDELGDSSVVTSTSDIQPSITCPEFLNALGYGLLRYQQSQDIDSFAMVSEFPNLNVLEDLLADCMIGSYTRYSALTIFSNLCYKHNEIAANYYYAILGVLSGSAQQLVWSPDQASETLAEKMMELCERKSDFSFIYSVADRDTTPGRRWRPGATTLPLNGEAVPSILRPIIAWHFYGEAQNGTFDEEGALTLHNMTSMRCVPPPRMSDVARVALQKWVGKQNSLTTDVAELAKLVYKSIQKIGFKGEADPIVVSDGLVFASSSISQNDIVDILVSNQIRFSRGAPGLVRYSGSGGETSYSPCLFIGAVDRLLEPGESVLL